MHVQKHVCDKYTILLNVDAIMINILLFAVDSCWNTAPGMTAKTIVQSGYMPC